MFQQRVNGCLMNEHMHAPAAGKIEHLSIALEPTLKHTMIRKPVRYNHVADVMITSSTRDQGTQVSESEKSRTVCSCWYHQGWCTKLDQYDYLHELDPSRSQVLAWKPRHQEGLRSRALSHDGWLNEGRFRHGTTTNASSEAPSSPTAQIPFSASREDAREEDQVHGLDDRDGHEGVKTMRSSSGLPKMVVQEKSFYAKGFMRF